jgi:hypothetical protein
MLLIPDLVVGVTNIGSIIIISPWSIKDSYVFFGHDLKRFDRVIPPPKTD